MMSWREATKLGTENLMALAQEHNLADEVLALKQQTRYWYFKACSLVRNRVNSPSVGVEIVNETPFDGPTATLSKPKKFYDTEKIRYALDNSDFSRNEKIANMSALAYKAASENLDGITDDDSALEMLKLACKMFD